MTKNTQTQTIAVEDFTEHPEVKKCLEQLKATFDTNGGREFIISDVLDKEGHQYVNLVQKGGGVLGIALVGYTYILEQMGIRFIRLAGTSAGAINTALMAVTGARPDEHNPKKIKGDKKMAKSEEILQAICDLNFFSLVDGHPAARWIIKNFITDNDFGSLVKKWSTNLLAILIALPVLGFICLGLQHQYTWVAYITKTVFIVTGFYLMLLIILFSYIFFLTTRLKNAGFGINPGDFFYDWIKKQLQHNNVNTVTDLIDVSSTPVDDLFLRVDNPGGLNELNGDVTFISSEIVSQNKIEFPKMSCLFKENIDDLQPAGFIRASMSIPLFFESYFITNIPCKDGSIRDQWMQMLGESNPPSTARFVDGGVLSNFPINIFYNPKVDTPRLPSLGIDLDDEKDPGDVFGEAWRKTPADKNQTDNEGNDSESWSLTGYFYRLFNTVRFYYDKDFLIKNTFFKKGIGSIPLKGFNWLNFFLDDKSKLEMFVLGAKSATEFLMQFSWEEYKSARKEMQVKLVQQKAAPDNNNSNSTSK
jgi:NTE family protein